MKTYQIKRTVLEIYEIEAKNRKEALALVSEKGDPHTIRIIRETVTVKT